LTAVCNKAGQFRVKRGDTVQVVDSIFSGSRASDPVTSLQDFYIKAHRMVKCSGLPNYRAVRLAVPSALNIEEWSKRLKDYKDYGIVDLLRFGFPLGYSSKRLPASQIKNHSGALEFPLCIDKYLESEIAGKNILGPFSYNPLQDLVFVSPLNTVPKKDSADRCIIADLSFPAGHSINDGIDKNLYLGEHVDLCYLSVDSLALELKKVGIGTLMYKKDLKKAYRQFKLDPGDISFLHTCGKTNFTWTWPL